MSESRKSGSHHFPRGVALSLLACAVLAWVPQSAHGSYHAVVIDEVLTSSFGDPNKQFIEMRMLGASQNFVANSVLAAFDALGNYVGDILVIPSNVSQSGAGTRWLVATLSFQQPVGISADFLMSERALPFGGGMICFGGGGGTRPLDPPNWDRTNFNNYADCVAYGSYSGPSNSRTGTPTTLNADGHSLQRTSNTRSNLADFTCADITAENNAGDRVEIPASDPCTTEGTPTATATIGATTTATPTPTFTLGTFTTPTSTPTVPAGTTATATSTATPGPPIPCVADCDENGEVSVDEVIRAINIALAPHLLDTCEQADPNNDGFPSINELLRAVASSMQDCTD